MITTEQDPRWHAVEARNAAADGHFVYAVKTTGVYCRPSCASRLAKARNVQFYESCEEAEGAGFRACKRCQPKAARRKDALVIAACRFIEGAEEPPALSEIAAAVGVSAFHLHRTFKAATGVTPKAYAAAHRARKVRGALRDGARVTDAMYAAGFNSSGRFYAASDALLGMAPSRFKEEGAGSEIRFAVGQCSLGSFIVAHSGKGVCAILLGDDPAQLLRDLQDQFRRATLVGGDAGFETLVARVVALVESPNTMPHLPLDIAGTAFQQKVWAALQRIPAGTTLSYSQLAARIGKPNAVRAVASACAANKIAIAIPCHRVVRKDGSLSGYRWGIERKRALLDRERDKRSIKTKPPLAP